MSNIEVIIPLASVLQANDGTLSHVGGPYYCLFLCCNVTLR